MPNLGHHVSTNKIQETAWLRGDCEKAPNTQEVLTKIPMHSAEPAAKTKGSEDLNCSKKNPC